MYRYSKICKYKIQYNKIQQNYKYKKIKSITILIIIQRVDNKAFIKPRSSGSSLHRRHVLSNGADIKSAA